MKEQQGRSETSRTSVSERGQCSPLTPQTLLVKHLRLHMVPREAKIPPERESVCGELKGGSTGKQRQRTTKIIIFVVILGDRLARSELTSFTNVMVLTANYEPHCEPLFCS